MVLCEEIGFLPRVVNCLHQLHPTHSGHVEVYHDQLVGLLAASVQLALKFLETLNSVESLKRVTKTVFLRYLL